ncbi:MAG: site-2 protease family protein [Clostridia bacterium]|nr:site-2 protease family protein [Clostridia bacterium]
MLYYILFNQDLTAEEAVIHFLITIGVFMISLTIHEFAHAFAAHKMGDDTAKNAGRMTLNPFKHLNLSGFIFFMLLGVGWAKPVPINPLNFKKYKKGTRWVSVSGVLANFLLGLISAIICAILIATVGLEVAVMEYVYTILLYIMMVNSFLALFNILPIPPLDGFNFVASFCKSENKFIKFMARNGSRILIGLILLGLLTDILFGFDILTYYLSLIYDWVYLPITFIGI